MDHNIDHYKQIILNNRTGGYKPNRELFESLRVMFPDLNILGFGKFSVFLWYVLASSKSFPENTYGVETTVYYHQILMWIPKKPVPKTLPIPPIPTDPTAS